MAYKYGQQLCDRPSYLHRWWRGEPAPTRASVRLNHQARAWSWNTRTRPLLQPAEADEYHETPMKWSSGRQMSWPAVLDRDLFPGPGGDALIPLSRVTAPTVGPRLRSRWRSVAGL